MTWGHHVNIFQASSSQSNHPRPTPPPFFSFPSPTLLLSPSLLLKRSMLWRNDEGYLVTMATGSSSSSLTISVSGLPLLLFRYYQSEKRLPVRNICRCIRLIMKLVINLPNHESIIFFIWKLCSSHVKVDEIGGTCSTHRGHEKCLPHFSRKNLKARDRMGSWGADERIILKRILK
jgi:hypothetical protein